MLLNAKALSYAADPLLMGLSHYSVMLQLEAQSDSSAPDAHNTYVAVATEAAQFAKRYAPDRASEAASLMHPRVAALFEQIFEVGFETRPEADLVAYTLLISATLQGELPLRDFQRLGGELLYGKHVMQPLSLFARLQAFGTRTVHSIKAKFMQRDLVRIKELLGELKKVQLQLQHLRGNEKEQATYAKMQDREDVLMKQLQAMVPKAHRHYIYALQNNDCRLAMEFSSLEGMIHQENVSWEAISQLICSAFGGNSIPFETHLYDAADRFRRAYLHALIINDLACAADVALREGMMLRQLRRYSDAMDAFQRAYTHALSTEDEALQTRASCEAARLLLTNKGLQQEEVRLETLGRAANLSKKQGGWDNAARFAFATAEIYLVRGDLENAVRFYSEAVDACHATKVKEMKMTEEMSRILILSLGELRDCFETMANASELNRRHHYESALKALDECWRFLNEMRPPQNEEREHYLAGRARLLCQLAEDRESVKSAVETLLVAEIESPAECWEYSILKGGLADLLGKDKRYWIYLDVNSTIAILEILDSYYIDLNPEASLEDKQKAIRLLSHKALFHYFAFHYSEALEDLRRADAMLAEIPQEESDMEIASMIADLVQRAQMALANSN